MPQIERPGVFKGIIKDSGVSETRKAKFPQLVLMLLATHLYNDATEEWDEWDFEHTITGYFVLVHKKDGQIVKCLAYDQLVEAVGWNGETYASLAAMDLRGKRVQFTVTEETYEGQTKCKVSWIAAEGADVGIRKFTGQDLAKLDASFPVVSSKPKTAAKPLSSGKKPASSKKKSTPPSRTPPSRTPAKTTPEAMAKVDSCTEIEAFDACIEVNNNSKKPLPEEIVKDYWTDRIEEIVTDSENITNEEWTLVRNAVVEDIESKF